MMRKDTRWSSGRRMRPISRLRMTLSGGSHHEVIDRSELKTGMDPIMQHGPAGFGPATGNLDEGGEPRVNNASQGTKSRFERWVSKPSQIVNLIRGLLALFGGVGAGLGFGHLIFPQEHRVSASIVEPRSGTISGSSPYPVTGSVHNLGDRQLWAAVQDLNSFRFNPDTGPCEVIGSSFSCPPTYVGGTAQHNARFRLVLWVVSLDQVQAIMAYNDTSMQNNYPGTMLPNGAEPVGRPVQLLRS